MNNAVLSIARQIPLEVAAGLLSGRFTLHGGVVRNVQGQIVKHLVSGAPSLAGLVPGGPVILAALKGAETLNDFVQTAQLYKLTKDVSKLQQAIAAVMSTASAGVAVSGIGAVTTIAGVAYLSNKLSQIDKKVDTISKDVKDVKEWLGGLERSQLRFAIDNIRHADATDDINLRKDLLLQSKKEFSTLTHHYREQWEKSKTVLEIKTIDDLYTLSMIGHAAVCSNLGMGAEAASGLRSDFESWNRQARHHANAILLADHPERLLSSEYVGTLPTGTIIELLDFANDSERGIAWIDDLRSAAPPKAASLTSRVPKIGKLSPKAAERASHEDAISAVKELKARADVLDANVAHYEFLRERRFSATQFQRQLEGALVESGAEAICVGVLPDEETVS